MENELTIIKQEHRWTKAEKSKFCGEGEWIDEVDYLHFEYLGYEAQVLRILKREPYAKVEAYFGGHLCGYVRIPENHSYFKKEDIDIDCHGGVTFNEAHEEHWIGFDCAHSEDIVPTMEHHRNTRPELINFRKQFPIPEGMEDYLMFNPVYRNMDFCIEECKSMIDQLIGVASINSIEKGLEAIKEFDGKTES